MRPGEKSIKGNEKEFITDVVNLINQYYNEAPYWPEDLEMDISALLQKWDTLGLREEEEDNE